MYGRVYGDRGKRGLIRVNKRTFGLVGVNKWTFGLVSVNREYLEWQLLTNEHFNL